MNYIPTLTLLLTAVITAGCFDHREAPRRLVSCATLDDAVAQRDTVEELTLQGQAFGDLPAEIGTFPRLERLILRNARVAGDFTPLAKARSLRMLDLSEMQLAAIPDAVFALSTLEQLYFTGNAATSLVSHFGRLPALTYLNLDRTPLEALPDSVGDLSNLRWLRLNNTRLTALPESVGRLSALERLYLRNSQLQTIPDPITSLTRLEDLSLSGNPIESFPEWLAALPRLRNLDLADTRITELPANLSGLTALQHLSLSRCPIPEAEKVRIRQALPACHVAF